MRKVFKLKKSLKCQNILSLLWLKSFPQIAQISRIFVDIFYCADLKLKEAVSHLKQPLIYFIYQ